MIAEPYEGFPAAKAGLQQHDILLNFGDAKISSLQELIAAVKAGDHVQVHNMKTKRW